MSALRLPHPLILLLGGIALAAMLTWWLPAGEFTRRDDPATGRRVVVAGTYQRVASAPVTPFRALVAVPRGMVEAAEVIISILLVGGAWALVDQLGTLGRGAHALLRAFRGRGLLAIPVITLVFTTFGAMENMQEEVIALVPVLLVIARGLGVDAVTAVAMSVGGAAVGAAFGPSNPYQAGIALKLAQLPLLSGGGLRLATLVVAWAVWIAWTMRYAARHRVAIATPGDGTENEEGAETLTGRDVVILALIITPLVAYVIGVLAWDWGFNELSALFFLAAILIGAVGRLGVSGSVTAYLQGMQVMVAAAVIVGVARGISVVLSDGRVIDTIVHGLATPLMDKPPALAALLMIPIQGLIHIAVPSVSGQATLTMPLLIPLSDLIGLSRQATILAYQTGAGLMELLSPTNGALMAVLLAARVPWGRWVAFAGGGWLLLTGVGAAGTLVAVWVGG